MIDYLKISNINDFIFCPLSIYFHNLYGSLDKSVYQGTYQINGTKVHETIDHNHYSNRKSILTGLPVYSDRLRIMGKIDIFDQASGLLTERKKKIKTIFDGYIFQLYAQYYCLTEMGYTVKQLKLYSYDDNKSYPVPLPDEDPIMQRKFFETIDAIEIFDISDYHPLNRDKCANCIYEPSCDRSLL